MPFTMGLANMKNLLSRGEIRLANFIPPANGANHGSFCARHSHARQIQPHGMLAKSK